MKALPKYYLAARHDKAASLSFPLQITEIALLTSAEPAAVIDNLELTYDDT